MPSRREATFTVSPITVVLRRVSEPSVRGLGTPALMRPCRSVTDISFLRNRLQFKPMCMLKTNLESNLFLSGLNSNWIMKKQYPGIPFQERQTSLQALRLRAQGQEPFVVAFHHQLPGGVVKLNGHKDEGAFGALQLAWQIGYGVVGEGHSGADFPMGRFPEFDIGAAQHRNHLVGPFRKSIEQPLSRCEFGERKLRGGGHGAQVVEVFRAVGQGEDGLIVMPRFEFQQACKGDFVQVHAGKLLHRPGLFPPLALLRCDSCT